MAELWVFQRAKFLFLWQLNHLRFVFVRLVPVGKNAPDYVDHLKSIKKQNVSSEYFHDNPANIDHFDGGKFL